MARSRAFVLGGEIYPAPGATSAQLHALFEAVRRILFRSAEFRVGLAGAVGAWRSGPQTLALHGKRLMFEALLRLFGALVQFGYIPDRKSILRCV